jgi:hypothetical protein
MKITSNVRTISKMILSHKADFLFTAPRRHSQSR